MKNWLFVIRFCIFSSKLTSKFSDMKKIYFTPNEGSWSFKSCSFAKDYLMHIYSFFMSIHQYTSNAYFNPKGQISDYRWHHLHLLPRFWQGKCHITCFKDLALSWQGIEPRSSACEANALARERDSNTGHYISSIANFISYFVIRGWPINSYDDNEKTNFFVRQKRERLI